MLVSNRRRLCLLSGVLLSVGYIAPSHAQEYPTISGEVVMELQNEYTANSDDPATDGYNNIFFRTEVAPTLRFNEHFFIDGVAVLENIQDRDLFESNFFDNEGIFIEEIKVNYENGPLSVFAGKFNPGFGAAWDFRGIWGEDFAEDYEITEKIGVGANYTFGNDTIGEHTVTANTFFADTTFLSGSLITNRNTLNKNDGGVSNTEDFSSFVVSLQGEDLAGVENLYYKLGYRNQDEGDVSAGGDRETGYAVTLGHNFAVNDHVGMDALVEYVDIDNFEAGTDDKQYLTTSLITTIDNQWNVTASYTARNTDSPSGDSDDHLFQLSGGYDFGQGTTAELGWRNSEEAGVDTDIVGALIRHTFEF
tara:strand:+ start:8557 stop:9645 length:1089 start_codon:yes stop_codon:yes gene_type:complete